MARASRRGDHQPRRIDPREPLEIERAACVRRPVEPDLSRPQRALETHQEATVGSTGTCCPKQQILQALEDLPEETTVEDAIERLYLLYKIERGIAQADAGQTVSQEEARQRLARWLV